MWNFMFFTDIIMIISGCIASTICGGEKWIFFGFSIIAFIPVLYYICWLRDTIVNANFYDPITGLMITGQKLNGQVLPYLWFYNTYAVIADLTVVAWFMYPIVWIFAEGSNKLSVMVKPSSTLFLTSSPRLSSDGSLPQLSSKTTLSLPQPPECPTRLTPEIPTPNLLIWHVPP